MLYRTLAAAIAFGLVPFTGAQTWFQISTPSPSNPWIISSSSNPQTNSISWLTGYNTGVTTFDIQLHNANKTLMVGFVPIALRVSNHAFAGGVQKGRVGGELAIDLQSEIPEGNGYSLIFMDTISGTVYAKSQKFSIYTAADEPSNYTTASLPDGAPSTTATLSVAPNPTQQWAITMDGTIVSTAAAETTSIAGNSGS